MALNTIISGMPKKFVQKQTTYTNVSAAGVTNAVVIAAPGAKKTIVITNIMWMSTEGDNNGRLVDGTTSERVFSYTLLTVQNRKFRAQRFISRYGLPLTDNSPLYFTCGSYHKCKIVIIYYIKE